MGETRAPPWPISSLWSVAEQRLETRTKPEPYSRVGKLEPKQYPTVKYYWQPTTHDTYKHQDVPLFGQRRQDNPVTHAERRQDGTARAHPSPHLRRALHRQDQIHNVRPGGSSPSQKGVERLLPCGGRHRVSDRLCGQGPFPRVQDGVGLIAY